MLVNCRIAAFGILCCWPLAFALSISTHAYSVFWVFLGLFCSISFSMDSAKMGHTKLVPPHPTFLVTLLLTGDIALCQRSSKLFLVVILVLRVRILVFNMIIPTISQSLSMFPTVTLLLITSFRVNQLDWTYRMSTVEFNLLLHVI